VHLQQHRGTSALLALTVPAAVGTDNDDDVEMARDELQTKLEAGGYQVAGATAVLTVPVADVEHTHDDLPTWCCLAPPQQVLKRVRATESV
jgi:hypothetical protein